MSITSKAEASVQRKKARLQKLTTDMVNPVQTATLIGIDANKSEYWVILSLFCAISKPVFVMGEILAFLL